MSVIRLSLSLFGCCRKFISVPLSSYLCNGKWWYYIFLSLVLSFGCYLEVQISAICRFNAIRSSNLFNAEWWYNFLSWVFSYWVLFWEFKFGSSNLCNAEWWYVFLSLVISFWVILSRFKFLQCGMLIYLLCFLLGFSCRPFQRGSIMVSLSQRLNLENLQIYLKTRYDIRCIRLY